MLKLLTKIPQSGLLIATFSCGTPPSYLNQSDESFPYIYAETKDQTICIYDDENSKLLGTIPREDINRILQRTTKHRKGGEKAFEATRNSIAILLSFAFAQPIWETFWFDHYEVPALEKALGLHQQLRWHDNGDIVLNPAYKKLRRLLPHGWQEYGQKKNYEMFSQTVKDFITLNRLRHATFRNEPESHEKIIASIDFDDLKSRLGHHIPSLNDLKTLQTRPQSKSRLLKIRFKTGAVINSHEAFATLRENKPKLISQYKTFLRFFDPRRSGKIAGIAAPIIATIATYTYWKNAVSQASDAEINEFLSELSLDQRNNFFQAIASFESPEGECPASRSQENNLKSLRR